MKPRESKFEPLLKYRTFMEETMKNELSDVRVRLDMEEKRLFALEEIWRHAVEEFEERQKRQIPPHEIFMYQIYLHQMSLEIETQQKKVLETQKLYHDKRESLIVASQDRKIVEKVKEKETQVIIRETNRAGKKVMDETATSRYLRKN